MADITQITGRSPVTVDLRASKNRRPAAGSPQESQDAAVPLARRERPEPPRVGFGNNTISAPAAALHTIGYGLKSAKQLVPSPQELQQEVRERTARAREEQAERFRATPERLDVTIGTDGGKEYIAALNEGVASAQARTTGEQPQPTTSASVKVGNQTTTFPSYAQNLDLRA